MTIDEWKTDILEKIRVGIMAIDCNYNITFVNKGASAIGISALSVTGLSIFEVFPNLKESESTFCKVIQTGRSVIDRIQTFVTSKGERRTALTSTFPIIQDGKIVGAYELFEDVSAVTRLADELETLRREKGIAKRKQPTKARETMETNIIGLSKSMRDVKNAIPKLAGTSSPLLLYGETGTGKEVIVNAIATDSGCSLISQNCAAIPENLLESILFGTTKGSFTGAEDRKGLFEQADGGILFLDEINSLPLTLQAKLLRVVQEKKVRRLGDTKEMSINIRFIAATNVHPSSLLESGKMRSDLYYRLHVMYLELPPLRNRKIDILPLTMHFISYFNEELCKDVQGIEEEALVTLKKHNWPGNVRELRNWIERAMNHVEGSMITKKDLQQHSYLAIENQSENFQPSLGLSLREQLKRAEESMIKQELERTHGNVSKAARRLELPQQTMSRKIKEYDLQSYVYELKLLNTQN
ncbi:sigma-54 interaction domain-containing protein [Cytobacillus sp. NCCP-133]|uniref:sigma-54 interaction domain-containing protein n=1 Tax=Cytobacillus sp. NCCP-133 TaxID=766848 RepID=UPI00222EFD4C|nr:sigma 54-interacting transcriptional regulator [Cytobacillus sp. NCCP-133]GLB61712.1 sigma-54-dependent Fis family transcriptional regulator [Cytobacillus sp. NCCP-133]